MCGREREGNDLYSFAIIMCEMKEAEKSRVAYLRLKEECDLGIRSVNFKHIFFVLSSPWRKQTNRGVEISKRIGSFLVDNESLYQLENAKNEKEVRRVFAKLAQKCQEERDTSSSKEGQHHVVPVVKGIGKGIWEDFKRRLSFYFSDYKDGIFGKKSIQKTLSVKTLPSLLFSIFYIFYFPLH